jgi:hypothetical protein
VVDLQVTPDREACAAHASERYAVWRQLQLPPATIKIAALCRYCG